MAMELSPSLAALPVELIREIIIAGIPPQPYLHERDNFPAARYRARWLSRLALVSRALNGIASPLLWSDAIFELSRENEQARLDAFYAQLVLAPHLGKRVKRLHWTQDLDQPAVERTQHFLSHHADSLPNLESVSCLAAIARNSRPSDSRDAPFPRLKEISLVSWDEEPLDGVARRADGSCGIDEQLVTRHIGPLDSVDTLTLSFATIQFAHRLLTTVPLPRLKHLHLFGSYETKIAYLPPALQGLAPLSALIVEEEGAHSLLREIFSLLGPQLQSLSLNLDGDPTQLRVPFPPSILELCPKLKTLSLDGAAAVRPLQAGHKTLRRLLFGHSAGHSRGAGHQERVSEVLRVCSELGEILTPDGDTEEAKKGEPFPGLESVAFWRLDVNDEAFDPQWRDWDRPEVIQAADILWWRAVRRGRKRVRLLDRKGVRLGEVE